MKNFFKRIFGSLLGSEQAYWVEVKTAEPACTYYFGPFDIPEEAELAKTGYVEDLEQEGAKQVQATVTRRQRPEQLTVFDENMDGPAPEPKPAYSGQS